MIKMVLKKFEKGSINMIFIFLIAVFAGCGNKQAVHKGFVLEEFVIDNVGLDSIVQSVLENDQKTFPCIESDTQKVLALNLQSNDSAILFTFSFFPQKELVYSIYRNNYRIVGYAEYNKHDVILLSDINHISDFGTLFAEFIHPTGNKKKFDYMIFPDNFYSGKENGTWPNYEMIYDSIFLVYKYQDRKFFSPILTTNIEQDSWNFD